MYATIFEKFMATFHFSNNRNRSLKGEPSEKVRYLMLDLLKHFLVVDHSKEDHNETVDYRRNPGGLLDQLEKSSKAIETLNQ